MASAHPRADHFIRAGLYDALTSFADLEKRIVNLGDENTKEQGDAFEIFFEAYLQTQPLMQSEAVWPVGQVPLEVRQTLKLPSDTKGIDGVFRTRTGDAVPYQVKFRSHRPRLSFTEVAPFLAVTDSVSDRLLVTNASAIAEDAVKRKHLRTLRGVDFDELTADDFAAINDWLRARPVRHSKITARPDQKEAVHKLVAALQNQDRATAVMACGTGKTLVQLWAAEALGAERILVLVPTLVLVAQTVKEWSRHTRWGDRFRYLCVCSDPTVTRGDEDPVILQPADLDMRVDTDPAIVHQFLSDPHRGVRVVFSTYQSARVVAEGSREGKPFDIGIFDEAHKTTGPSEGMFAFALRDSNLRIRRRVFFTATPRIHQQTRDGEGDFKLVSMDDRTIYGPVVHELSFADAFKAGIICDYRVILSLVDPAELTAAAIEHGTTLVEGDLQATAWVAVQIAIQRAIQDTGVSKVITFHSRVNHARIFAGPTERGIGKYIPEFTTAHVNGEMSAADRRDILKGFSDGHPRLVTNARCLTEGVDLPAVDMVAFINPKKSKVDIVQATGRAMRKPRDREKTYGYIVVPVLLEREEGQSIEEAVQRTHWEDLITVLAALCDSDTRLVDVIAQLQMAKGCGEVFNPRFLAERVQVIGPQVDLETIRRGIYGLIAERLGVPWAEMYGRLVAYKAKNGDCNVPAAYPENRELGYWCNSQRQIKKKGKLEPERIRRLDELEFVWELHNQWDEMYERLVAYKDKNGDCNVPNRYSDDPPKLGKWCGFQRTSKKKGKLEPNQIRRLEDLGFRWEPFAILWEEMYGRLLAYKDTNGDCNVPASYPEDPKLSQWCGHQRQSKKKGKLEPDRIKRLDELGFVWGALALMWDKMYGRLVGYKNNEGDCDVPSAYPEDPKLGGWCGHQRQSKKKGKLEPDRISRLEALGFVWDQKAGQWDEMYGRLLIYKNKRGDCNVAAGYSDDPNLAPWCANLRRSRKENSLEPERINLLEDLGFEWDPFDTLWDEMYGRLVAYRDRNGDCNVPQSYPEDPKLGKWCGHQRQFKKKGTLNTDRIKRLGDLGFLWDQKTTQWDEMYGRLVTYKNINGHCNVPARYSDDPKLASWCSNQRTSKRAGKLEPDRIQRLDEIGLMWEPFDTQWDEMYGRLVAYRDINGDCSVPARYSDNPKLGSWCSNQRRRKKKGKLEPDQIRRLGDLDFVWDLRTTKVERTASLRRLRLLGQQGSQAG